MSDLCRDVRLHLSRLRPTDMPPSWAADHLEGCPACRAEREADARVWGALGLLPSPAASPDFFARLEARRSAARPRRWLDSPHLWRAAAAACALLGLMAGREIGAEVSRPQGPGPAAQEPAAPPPYVGSFGAPPGSLAAAFHPQERLSVMASRALKLALIASVSLNAGLVLSLARRGEAGGPAAHEHQHARPLPSAELGLSPDQARRFEAASADFRSSESLCTERLPALRSRLIDELFRDEPAFDKVEGLLADMEREVGAYQRKLAERILAEKAILTPAQREQYREWLGRSECQ